MRRMSSHTDTELESVTKRVVSGFVRHLTSVAAEKITQPDFPSQRIFRTVDHQAGLLNSQITHLSSISASKKVTESTTTCQQPLSAPAD